MTTMSRGGNRFLSALNRRYIYGRVPLLHTTVFILQMFFVTLLTRRFNSFYAARPILTTMVTNALLGGIADTVAQSLTAIHKRGKRLQALKDNKDDDSRTGGFIELESFDTSKKDSATATVTDDLEFLRENPDAALRGTIPSPFDFERLTRFMAYGFLMAPVQHKWFSFLSTTFPIIPAGAKSKLRGPGGTTQALKRVAMDQLIFAPIGLSIFFTFMTVAEGGGKRAIARKFQEVYIPALKANFMVWPFVQILNFRVIPLQFQIPFVSTVGIAWTAYLSLTNASEEE